MTREPPVDRPQRGEMPGSRGIVAFAPFRSSLRELRELVRLRASLRRRLQTGTLAAERVDDAVLVVSELATNALEAAVPGTTVEVEVHGDTRTVVVEVSNETRADAAIGLDGVRMPGADASRGRGLPTVASIASRLSASIVSSRTVLRAELAV